MFVILSPCDFANTTYSGNRFKKAIKHLDL